MDRRFGWFVTPKLAANLPVSSQSLANARITAKLLQARVSLLHGFNSHNFISHTVSHTWQSKEEAGCTTVLQLSSYTCHLCPNLNFGAHIFQEPRPPKRDLLRAQLSWEPGSSIACPHQLPVQIHCLSKPTACPNPLQIHCLSKPSWIWTGNEFMPDLGRVECHERFPTEL